MAKSPTRLAAEKLCAKFPETPSRTLAKKLSDSHQIPLEQARGYVRASRGNYGEAKRKHATVPRDNQPAGWKPEPPVMPDSLAEEWLPFDLGNDIRVGVISDVHIPFHSQTALSAAVKCIKKRKPTHLFINGDFADYYSISRHQKDPSKRNFKNEQRLVRQGLSYLRKEFVNCEIKLKLGNHEERWQHYLWNSAPEISDDERMKVGKWIDADQYGIEVIEDQRPVMAGHLPILHGHELGKQGVAAPVNPARGLFMRTMSTMLIGHGHRTSQHTETDVWHIDTTCWSTGCLCNMNPEYARVNKWNQGAAFVEVDRTGEFHVDNFRIGPAGEIW